MRTTHNSATPLEFIRTQVKLYCSNGFKCDALQVSAPASMQANQIHLDLPRSGIVIMYGKCRLVTTYIFLFAMECDGVHHHDTES